MTLETWEHAQKHDRKVTAVDCKRDETRETALGDRHEVLLPKHVERAAEDVDIGLTERLVAYVLDVMAVTRRRRPHLDRHISAARLMIGAGHRETGLREREVLATRAAPVVREGNCRLVSHVRALLGTAHSSRSVPSIERPDG
jgi:hypothetical protein